MIEWHKKFKLPHSKNEEQNKFAENTTVYIVVCMLCMFITSMTVNVTFVKIYYTKCIYYGYLLIIYCFTSSVRVLYEVP